MCFNHITIDNVLGALLHKMLNKKNIGLYVMVVMLGLFAVVGSAVANTQATTTTTSGTGTTATTTTAGTGTGTGGGTTTVTVPVATGPTLGDTIIDTGNQIKILPSLISYLAYISGVIFAATGLYKLRQHVEFGPQSVQLPEPLKYLFTGGLMMTLPTVSNVIMETFQGGAGQVDLTWSTIPVTTGGLDNMIIDFIDDIYAPMIKMLIFFCYVAGAALALVAIHRFTKTAQEGPRGPTGMGTVATFLLAGMLFSAAPSMGMIVETIFGGRDSMTGVAFMGLSASVSTTQAENVISAILAFLIIVGILSVIRGFFVLRGVAEGDQQMTMMSGVSHVIAGAILVNFGQFANIIQNTLGLTAAGYGLNFY